jgi:hypothetical protein
MKDQRADDKDRSESAELVSALGPPRRSRRCESADRSLTLASGYPIPRPVFTSAFSLKTSAFPGHPIPRQVFTSAFSLKTSAFPYLRVPVRSSAFRRPWLWTLDVGLWTSLFPSLPSVRSQFRSLSPFGSCCHLSSVICPRPDVGLWTPASKSTLLKMPLTTISPASDNPPQGPTRRNKVKQAS